MMGRRAYERQPEREVDGAIELERLERDQALIVIHRDRCVEGEFTVTLDKGSIGRERSVGVDSDASCAPDRGINHPGFLIAKKAIFARVRIKTEHSNSRRRNPEATAQVFRQ